MSKKAGNPVQKAMAVILSAVLLTGLISGAAPIQSKAEESSSAAAVTSQQSGQNRDNRNLLEVIKPVIYTPLELDADMTGAIPLPRELEDEILAGTTVEGIAALDRTEYSLSASYDSDTQICTVSFDLTDLGKEKYFLSSESITTATCRVKFHVAKKEITPFISVPQELEFDGTKGVLSERAIEEEVLNKVSVTGIDLLKQSDYTLDAVYDAQKSICTISFALSSEGSEQYELSKNAKTAAECKIIIRRGLADAVSMKIEEDEAAPELSIVTELQTLTDVILSEEEKEAAQTGTDISLVFHIKDGENILSSTDKETIIQTLKDYQIGQYLDISLFKVMGEERSQITKAAGNIRLTLTLPESLTENGKKTTREFAVVRIHEGEVTVLPDMDTDSASVTVDTDRFSAYAIVYKDIAEADNTGGNDNQVTNSDNTGGNNNQVTNSDKASGNTENNVTNDNTGNVGNTDNTEEADNKKNTGKTVTSGKKAGKTGSSTSAHNRSSDDDDPQTGDNMPLEFYATITMISGLSYVLLLFRNGRCGMTELKKKELVSRIVRWACRGGKFRRIMAYAAIVLLLVYYHSIGKKMSVKYEEIEKDLLCEK